MRGLYIHIPFCKHICLYCDFRKTVTFKRSIMDEYINYLNNEILSYKDKYLDVETIYIGGGTPNALPLDLLEKLLDTIDSFKEKLNIKEYSIEINPELLDIDQANLFKKHNITRVSIGAESFNDDILVKLGRHHKRKDIFNSVKLLKNVGINNINIDLIFSHPFDNLALVKENLEYFYQLDIPHISYYSMILEDKTVFKYQYDRNEIDLPDEDISADLYEYIMKDLSNNGYIQYEISNFARIGFESIHNEIYWKDLEYIGCGLNASGYLDNVRYTNDANFKLYYQNKKEITKISDEDHRNEFMMLGLRMTKGVSISEYRRRFGSEMLVDYNLDKFIKDGLLVKIGDFIRFTKRGLMLGDIVFMEFV